MAELVSGIELVEEQDYVSLLALFELQVAAEGIGSRSKEMSLPIASGQADFVLPLQDERSRCNVDRRTLL